MFLRPMEPEDVELVHGWQEDGEHRRLMGDPPWVEAVAWCSLTRPTMGSTTIDTATSRMMAGALVTCPPDPECGKTPAPKIGD